MKYTFYLFLLSFSQLVGCSNVNAQIQNSRYSFHLNGTINVDTGTVILLPTGGKDYDPNKTNKYSAKIKQGTFTFDGQIVYPCSFIIAFFPTYVSSPFIIEAGTQTIVCNVDSVREIPKIHNKYMRELEIAPVNFFSSLSVSANRKSLLLNYVKQHPDSYIGLWETVRQVENGYDPALDSIYNAFSISVKNSYTGKVIAQRLKSSKITAIGHVFPTLTLLDTNSKPVSVPTQQKSSYTLIDFWYSHCTACLVEFPKLINLFESYKGKGFNIVGISIDRQVDIKVWKRTTKERGLLWPQYVDLAGKLTTNKLSINYFPSNFLLDEKGTIVKKNISPAELNKFLAERL